MGRASVRHAAFAAAAGLVVAGYAAAPRARTTTLRFVAAADGGTLVVLRAAPGAPAPRRWARACGTSEDDSVVALYVDRGPRPDSVRVAVECAVSDSTVVLRPRFPLVPGLSYAAVVDRGRDGPLVTRLTVPAVGRAGEPVVERVYPTADTLPENLLRFHVQFSRPMRVGDAAEHVALLDETGRPVAGAFLDTTDELWDRSRRRLTLLLDPGRIKRGLRPNREFGTPLRAGHRYTLRIGAGWRDADGMPTVGTHHKVFVAGAPLRARVAPDRWRVRAPSAATRDPIELVVDRHIDGPLVRRSIRVRAHDGHDVPTDASTDEGERVIRMRPQQPWRAGSYQVVVDAGLEDVAGNDVRRAFDLDLTRRSDRPHDALRSVTIPVRIRHAHAR
jgi:hypothetical protein